LLSKQLYLFILSITPHNVMHIAHEKGSFTLYNNQIWTPALPLSKTANILSTHFNRITNSNSFSRYPPSIRSLSESYRNSIFSYCSSGCLDIVQRSVLIKIIISLLIILYFRSMTSYLCRVKASTRL